MSQAGVRWMRRTAVGALLWFLFGAIGTPPAEALPLVNGDFQEDVILDGWTLFTTANGTDGRVPDGVVPFVTKEGSALSLSAEFNVGKLDQFIDGFGGGGILQEVNLEPGFLQISADIATFKDPKPGLTGIDDNHGGLFEILVDGIVRASFDFGMVLANETHFGVLSLSNLGISGGLHDIAFRMTRPYLNDTGFLPDFPSPRQYIDNITLTVTEDIPEPHTLLLLAASLLGLITLRRSSQPQP
jgi:hypothetical protein